MYVIMHVYNYICMYVVTCLLLTIVLKQGPTPLPYISAKTQIDSFLAAHVVDLADIRSKKTPRVP